VVKKHSKLKDSQSSVTLHVMGFYSGIIAARSILHSCTVLSPWHSWMFHKLVWDS